MKHCFELTETGSDRFVIENGLLVERMSSWVKYDSTWLIVLLPLLIPDVFEVAHCSLTRGHQGIKRTTERINSLFSALKLQKQIHDLIRVCHACRIHASPKKGDPRFPLQPLPIIGLP